jgi:hypothetical protein
MEPRTPRPRSAPENSRRTTGGAPRPVSDCPLQDAEGRTCLLDQAKLGGFVFRQVAPGEDGPLVGHRLSGDRVDVIHLAGFSRDCLGVRQRTSPLIVPGAELIERRVQGSAIEVLTEVLAWEPAP